jgi:hypothetical protein
MRRLTILRHSPHRGSCHGGHLTADIDFALQGDSRPSRVRVIFAARHFMSATGAPWGRSGDVVNSDFCKRH